MGVEAIELSRSLLDERLLPFIETYLKSAAKTIFGQSEGLAAMDKSFIGDEPTVNLCRWRGIPG